MTTECMWGEIIKSSDQYEHNSFINGCKTKITNIRAIISGSVIQMLVVLAVSLATLGSMTQYCIVTEHDLH